MILILINFNKELRVNYDVTRRCRVSKFATLGVKIIKLKLPCSIQQITTVFLDLFSPKMFFSLGFKKKISTEKFPAFFNKVAYL